MDQRWYRKAVSALLAFCMLFANTVPVFAGNETGTDSFSCGLEEHLHTDACYENVLICGETEHPVSDEDILPAQDVDEDGRHTEACYEKRLVCGRQEHTHTETCLRQETPEAIPEEKAAEFTEETSEPSENTQTEEQTGAQNGEPADTTTEESEGQTEPATEEDQAETVQPAEGATDSEITDAETTNSETTESGTAEKEQITPAEETAEEEQRTETGTTAREEQPAETDKLETAETAEAAPEEAEAEIPEFDINGDTLRKYNGEDETVTIPDGIRVIGSKAFAENRKIKTVILPDAVETIQNYAFAECSNLEKVVTGSETKLNTIGIGAFKNDKKLDISFAKDVKVIVSNAFEGISTGEEETAEETVEETTEEITEETTEETTGTTNEEATEKEPEQSEETGQPEQPEEATVEPEETNEEPEKTIIVTEETSEEIEKTEETGKHREQKETEGPETAEEPATPTDLEVEPEEEETFSAGTIESAYTPFLVTISYNSDACIPEGTTVVVSDADEDKGETPGTAKKAGDEEPVLVKSAKRSMAFRSAPAAEEEPHAQIPSLTTWSTDTAAPEIVLYQKTIDISLVSEGEEIEPNPDAEITVSIALPGIEDGQDVQVRHFTEDGPVLLDSTNNGGVVTFTTNSFSLFEFTSKAQQIGSWTSSLLENTFFGKSSNQETDYSEISVDNDVEGLDILEAFTVTRSSDLWMTLQRIKDLVLGKLESIVLYTVENGKLGAIVKENISLTDILRFSLNDLSSFALVKDTGFRHKNLAVTLTNETEDGQAAEESSVILDGMMPKESVARVQEVSEIFDAAEFENTKQAEENKESEENGTELEANAETQTTVLAAYDISIQYGEETYQPGEDSPISVEIADSRITTDKELELWHIRDDGTKERVTEFTAENGRIAFAATGFSVYVVTHVIHTYYMDSQGNTYRITVEYDDAANLPEDVELDIREVEGEDYIRSAAEALETREDYLLYTRFLDISFVKKGTDEETGEGQNEIIEPQAPVKVSVQLMDVTDGADALQVVHFGKDGAEKLASEATEEALISFEANSFSVFGFGNVLQPLTTTETEEANIEILGFSGEAQLTAKEAPEMEEGLEVLSTFTLNNNSANTEGQEETETNPETEIEQEPQLATNPTTTPLWIKAELKAGTELSEMESVVLYAVDGEETAPIIDTITTDGQVTKLEASDIAIVKDTGYRHLNLILSMDENGQAESKPETANQAEGEEQNTNQTETTETEEAGSETGNEEAASHVVILDGMMPKEAGATVVDVTEAYTDHEYAVPEEEQAEAEETEEEEKVSEESQENAQEDELSTTGQERPESEGDTTETGKTTEGEATQLEANDLDSENGEGTEEAEPAEEKPVRTTLAAYNITISNNESEYQPDPDHPITVEIRDDRITADGNIELWHIKDDGTEEQVEEFVIHDGGVKFTAYGFSVYTIVEGPETYVVGNAVTVQTLEELAANYNNAETGGKGFYLSYTNGQQYYFTNAVNESKGSLREKTSLVEASKWYLESAGTENTYYIYTYVNNVKQYIKQKSEGNNEIKLDSTGTAIIFQGNTDNNTSAPFYLKHNSEDRWLQHSGSGEGIRFWTDNNNTTNSRITLTYVYSTTMPDDPYELDGKAYGLMRYKDGIRGYALMSSANGNALKAQDMLVKENPLNRAEDLYVARGTDISMWQFHIKEKDQYTLSTDVNGVTKYMKINDNDTLSLADSEGDASVIQVIPGIGSYAGKIRLKNISNGKSVQMTGSKPTDAKFISKTDKVNEPNQYLNFVSLSNLDEEDFVGYSAQKVSVAGNLNQVTNGDLIIIYTRKWDPQEKKYYFYVLDYNGELVRAYEEGDSIQWIGTKINTAVWHFTEYYWEGTTDPNFYYDIKNDYTGMFLAPQVSGQIFAASPIGINLNGRRYNDYYSTILAWDDPMYAYAGIKTNDAGDGIEPCRIGKAEDFYFAKMEIADPTKLTEVSTIDHTEYGITMRMIDFNNKIAKYDGTTTDSKQHEVIGNSKYVQFEGVPGLLSTDLKANGYPTATITSRSLSELFANATEVNHLFLGSTYNGSGYFSYDSSQNFASLQGSQFKVYKEIGTNDTSATKDSLKHGNFFPYNDLEPGRFSSLNPENLYTASLEELPEDHPRKHEKLYLVDDPPDYYFGLEITASFVQTPNGKDAWNHDIIYEFTGDDDFWLYVDDELVVDLGGIHSALSAKVNYATGEVTVKNKQTDLYTIFRENYIARYNVDVENEEQLQLLQAYLDEKFTTKEGKKVFKDYSTHTMKIFYMERGAGASNLKMRFNLASMNPNQILLSKDVSGIADAEYLTTKFAFQIHYQPQGENEFITLKQQKDDNDHYNVTYKNTDEAVEYEPTNYSFGGKNYPDVFFLKPGQSAEINMPENFGRYYIVECGVAGNIYNKYEEDGQTVYKVVVNDDDIYGVQAGTDGGYATYDYTTSQTKLSERAHVVFRNHVNEDYIRSLSITKRLEDAEGNPLTYSQDRTGFRYRLYLGENLGYYNMGEYYVKDPSGYYCRYSGNQFVSIGKNSFETLTEDDLDVVTFISSPAGSIDKIPTGYTVEVRDLPVGTKFKVEERTTDMPKGYRLKEYVRDGDTYTHEGIVNEGKIAEGQNAHIFVDNKRGWGLTVNKDWTDKHFAESHEDIYVAVYTEDSATSLTLLPGSVRRIRHPDTSVYYFFEQLVPGIEFAQYHVYEVKLTDPIVADDEGVVSGYGSIERIEDNEAAEFKTKIPSESQPLPFPYLVTYTTGTATGEMTPGNIRTDIVTNTRGGGIILRLYDWAGSLLPNGVFKLQLNGVDVGEETYTSDNHGLITILYDFEVNTEYTLTEVASPEGYQGIDAVIHFKIERNEGVDNISAWVNTEGHEWDDWFEAEKYPNTSGKDLIAYVNVKNKQVSFRALKTDTENNLLEGAHFALYKQFIVNGQPIKDYDPVPGFEDIVSNEYGVVPGVDMTLTPRTYYLTETAAPENYEPYEGDIIFTITDLGYVSSTPSTLLNVTETQGIVTYTMTIQNKKPVLTPPILSISKFVAGTNGNTTLPFRFVISGLQAGKEYVYERMITDDGVNWRRAPGQSSLGFVKVEEGGIIQFDLMHHQKIRISLPYEGSFSVVETPVAEYEMSYSITEGADQATQITNGFEVDTFTSNINVEFTNTCRIEDVPIAPTDYGSRHMPFYLMLILGAVLLVLGGGWKIKAGKAGTADNREEKAIYRTGLTTETENHVRWRNSLWVNNKGDPPSPRADTGGPPGYVPKANALPPCPRAALWTKGSPGRGESGG